MMSCIEFEDERVVDFGPGPYSAGTTEKQCEKPHQEVATIDLYVISARSRVKDNTVYDTPVAGKLYERR